jgi:aspartate oxidase
MHGANRLGSNSLLEALATGTRAGERLAEQLLPPAGELSVTPAVPGLRAADRTRLQHLMSCSAGIARDEAGLAELVDDLDRLGIGREPATAAEAERAHLRVAALLVARSALVRRESRGSHRRTDHPRPDPIWRRPVLARLDDGTLRTSTDKEQLTA